MKLVLEHCTVRDLRKGDARSIAHYANNYRIWRNVRDRFPYPYTLKNAVEFLVTSIADKPRTTFAIDVEGDAVGCIGIIIKKDIYKQSGEIGYWLGEPFWGRGIITEALSAVTNYAFKEFNLVRLYAGVFSTNPASARVLEKAGYEFEGRLRNHVTKEGRVLDELIYAKLL